jgi:hypothetical protein
MAPSCFQGKKIMGTYVQKIDFIKDQGTKPDLLKTLGDLGEGTMRSCGGRHCGECVGRKSVGRESVTK